MSLTLPAPGQRSVNSEMAHKDIHRLGRHVPGQLLDDPSEPFFEHAGMLVGVGAHDLLGLDDPAL